MSIGRKAPDAADAAVAGVVERAVREAYGRLLARLGRLTRDLQRCEDALSDAFAQALTTWPETGVPDQPESWLLAVARNRLRDDVRHRGVTERIHALLAETGSPTGGLAQDDRLPLIMTLTHPAIDATIQAPLLLQVMLGLDAAQVARAFLVTEGALTKRLVRAKRKIRDAGIPFEPPPRRRWNERLPAVLDALYAAFGRSWDLGLDRTAPAEAEQLARCAVDLARLVVREVPDHTEGHALLALMQYVLARRGARTRNGRFVPLDDQDPALWDASLLAAAEASLGAAGRTPTLSRFALEAAIQSAHTARIRHGVRNRPTVTALYAALVRAHPTVGALLGYCAALTHSDGPRVAWSVFEQTLDPQPTHQPWWAVRADLLARLGRLDEARIAYDEAISLTGRRAVQAWLEERRAAL